MLRCALPTKGGLDVNIWYARQPRDQKSTALVYPLRVSISGAMYSLVPQSVRIVASWFSSFAAMYDKE